MDCGLTRIIFRIEAGAEYVAFLTPNPPSLQPIYLQSILNLHLESSHCRHSFGRLSYILRCGVICSGNNGW